MAGERERKQLVSDLRNGRNKLSAHLSAADLLEADAAELARCTLMIAERDNRIEILEGELLARGEMQS